MTTHTVRTTGSIAIDERASEAEIDPTEAAANQLIGTMTAKPALLINLKSLFTRIVEEHEILIIDQPSAALEEILHQMLPAFRIKILPATDDLTVISDCLAVAVLSVSGYRTTLIYCIFLSPGTSVIEVQ
jgi:hypothetical protein